MIGSASRLVRKVGYTASDTTYTVVHAHVRWTFPMIDAYLIPSSNAAITILCLLTYLLEKRVTELGALPVCADTVAQVRVVRVL